MAGWCPCMAICAILLLYPASKGAKQSEASCEPQCLITYLATLLNVSISVDKWALAIADAGGFFGPDLTVARCFKRCCAHLVCLSLILTSRLVLQISSGLISNRCTLLKPLMSNSMNSSTHVIAALRLITSDGTANVLFSKNGVCLHRVPGDSHTYAYPSEAAAYRTSSLIPHVDSVNLG